MLIEPLTKEAFAEFGVLIRHPGGLEREYLPAALATRTTGLEAAIWLNAVPPATWPLQIEKLERHPHGAQSFVPLGGGQMLVVVCGEDGDGMPDMSRLRGFLCPRGTGFSYHPGVWHHGLTGYGAAMDVLVVMAAYGAPDDTQWFTLPTSITIEEHDLS